MSARARRCSSLSAKSVKDDFLGELLVTTNEKALKALDSYIDAFRVSFPADRASAYWCLRDLCDILRLGTGSNAKKIKKAIKDCVDIIYTD